MKKKTKKPGCLEITDMGLKSLNYFLSSNTLHPETHFGRLHCLFKALHWHEIIFLLCLYCLGKKPSCVPPSFPGCLIRNKFWATLMHGFFQGWGSKQTQVPVFLPAKHLLPWEKNNCAHSWNQVCFSICSWNELRRSFVFFPFKQVCCIFT